MNWDGTERRSGTDRRRLERRQTIPYNVTTMVVVDGITWIDDEGKERRRWIRRRQDRMEVAQKILDLARPEVRHR